MEKKLVSVGTDSFQVEVFIDFYIHEGRSRVTVACFLFMFGKREVP